MLFGEKGVGIDREGSEMTSFNKGRGGYYKMT